MKRFLAVLLGVFAFTVSASAEPIKPAVEVRVKAVAELAPLLEYGGALFGQEDAGKQFAGLLQQFAKNEGGYEGIDLNRPIGAYVGVADTVEDSPVVVMVPVADEKAVLAALAEKLTLDPKKGDDGAYTVDVPGVPVSVHFRFADKYAYLTIRSDKGIDPKRLIAPKDFFAAKPDGFVSAVVHLDRWPADVKKFVWGTLEERLSENNKNLVATPVQQLFNDFLADVTVDAVKTALTDGDRFTVTLDVDPKTDDWKFAVSLSAKPGTTLDKTLAGFADRPSVAAGVAAAGGPLGHLGLNVQLPPETTKKFATVLDAAVKQAINDAKETEKANLKIVADLLLPTAKAGDFQLGVTTTPPATSGGKPGLLAAVKTVGGKQIEVFAKLGAAAAIPKDQGTFEGDVAEVGERKLHKLTLKQEPDAPFALGTNWVLTSDDLIAVAADPKDDGLKALAAAKPAKTPLFFAELSFARAVPLFEKQSADAARKAVADVFGDGKPDGKDTLKVVARGGKTFDLSVTVKGKAIALMAALDRAKKGE